MQSAAAQPVTVPDHSDQKQIASTPEPLKNFKVKLRAERPYLLTDGDRVDIAEREERRSDFDPINNYLIKHRDNQVSVVIPIQQQDSMLILKDLPFIITWESSSSNLDDITFRIIDLTTCNSKAIKCDHPIFDIREIYNSNKIIIKHENNSSYTFWNLTISADAERILHFRLPPSHLSFNYYHYATFNEESRFFCYGVKGTEQCIAEYTPRDNKFLVLVKKYPIPPELYGLALIDGLLISKHNIKNIEFQIRSTNDLDKILCTLPLSLVAKGEDFAVKISEYYSQPKIETSLSEVKRKNGELVFYPVITNMILSYLFRNKPTAQTSSPDASKTLSAAADSKSQPQAATPISSALTAFGSFPALHSNGGGVTATPPALEAEPAWAAQI